MRERNDDPGQKRRGHRYSAHPSNQTISIDYPDRRSVNYLDHSHRDSTIDLKSVRLLLDGFRGTSVASDGLLSSARLLAKIAVLVFLATATPARVIPAGFLFRWFACSDRWWRKHVSGSCRPGPWPQSRSPRPHRLFSRLKAELRSCKHQVTESFLGEVYRIVFRDKWASPEHLCSGRGAMLRGREDLIWKAIDQARHGEPS
jgi:hypothetical protein